MDKNAIALTVIAIVAVFMAGCTAVSPDGGTNTTLPTSVGTPLPVDNQTCLTDADRIPAQCCHPTSYMNRASVHVCNFACTASCERPLDCGAGSCGCVDASCSVVPAASSAQTSLHLTASPQRYTPLTSSTVGVGIELNASGFYPAGILVTWNATYGYFLSWGPVDYTVKNRGNPVTNHGEKLYWSFIDKPVSVSEPVVVTVTATDPATGRLLGNSTVTLGWEGDYTVMVREIR